MLCRAGQLERSYVSSLLGKGEMVAGRSPASPHPSSPPDLDLGDSSAAHSQPVQPVLGNVA